MTNTPDNDRHERALEKAEASLSDWIGKKIGTNAVEVAFARYLSEMDSVIVPREPTDAMVEAWRNDMDAWVNEIISDPVHPYRVMLSAAPHHFNQEGK